MLFRHPTGSRRRALCVFMGPAASLLAVLVLLTSLLTVSQTLMSTPSAAAAIRLNRSGDPYLPGAVTSAADLPAPDFSSSSETATDVTGNSPASPGYTVQYNLTIINSGDDPSTNTVVSDPLPPDATFVPGSLAIVAADGTAAPLTDIAGDDQAEFDPATNTVTARLGCGADASTGGVIVSASTTNSSCTTAQTGLSFRVTLGAAVGTPPTDGPQLNYTAQTSGVNASYDVTPTSSLDPGEGSNVAQNQGGPAVAISDLASSVVPTAAAGFKVSVQYGPDSEYGPDSAADGTLTVNLPPGLDNPAVGLDTASIQPLDVSSSCLMAGLLLTCSVGSLANGDNVVLDVQGVAASSLQDGAKLTATAWLNTDPPDIRLNSDPATAQITVRTASPNTSASTATAPSTTTPTTSTSSTATPTTTVPSTRAPTTTAPSTTAPTTTVPTTPAPATTAPEPSSSTAAAPPAPAAAVPPAPFSAAVQAPLAAVLPALPDLGLPDSATALAPPPTVVVPSAPPPTEMPLSVAPANVGSPDAPASASAFAAALDVPPSVTPPTDPDPPALPAIFERLAATGSNPFAGAGVGVILLVAGLLLMVARGIRRRR